MLGNPRIQRFSRPWPDVIEVILGALVIWGAQLTGALVVSRQGTVWLLAVVEALVVVGLLGLRLSGQGTQQWRLVLASALLLGASYAGMATGESEAWLWLSLVGAVWVGFVLRAFWAALIYPLPVFGSAFLTGDELASYLLVIGSFAMVVLTSFGCFIRYWCEEYLRQAPRRIPLRPLSLRSIGDGKSGEPNGTR